MEHSSKNSNDDYNQDNNNNKNNNTGGEEESNIKKNDKKFSRSKLGGIYNGGDDDDDDDEQKQQKHDSTQSKPENGFVDNNVENKNAESDEENNNDNDPRGGDNDGVDDEDENENSSDDNDDDENGLSSYERLRLERIKRNQEYLAKLGLEGKSIGEAVGSSKKPPKKTKPKPLITPTRKRSTLSRGSKEGVNYKEIKPTWLFVEKKSEPQQQQKSKKAKNESSPKAKKKSRHDLFIHREFSRLKSCRTKAIGYAKKNLRYANRYYKYWHRKFIVLEQEEERLRIIKERAEAEAEEKRILGTSKAELVKEIDQEMDGLVALVKTFDDRKQKKKLDAAALAQKEEHSRKMQMIDALDRFPKAMKDAFSTLNAMLYERSPKDPPPLRRSKRKSDSDTASVTPKKKKAKTNSNKKEENSPEAESSKTNNGEFWNMTSLGSETVSDGIYIGNGEESHDNKNKALVEQALGVVKRRRKGEQRAMNVGGWVSPVFSKSLTRTWLEKLSPPAKFDLASYAPQVGDIVLYYPAGHREFLEAFPDVLNAKLKHNLRIPLWHRARKEMAREDQSTNSTSQPDSAKKSQKKQWWSMEWLESFEDGFGNYPLVCRIERVHAEFPPDPDAEDVTVDEGKDGVKVTFQLKGLRKKKKKNPMRLVVLLHPFTPLIPPLWSESGFKDDDLGLPPRFKVVTFPSNDFEPFLVPFSWAYIRTQMLVEGMLVVSKGSTGEVKGDIDSFINLGDRYGSFRLSDKLGLVQRFMSQLKGGPASIQSELKELLGGTRAGLNVAAFPYTDACLILDCFTKLLEKQKNSPIPEYTGKVSFVDLVRSTLPLFKGVTIRKDSLDRKQIRQSSWDMVVVLQQERRKGASIAPPTTTLEVEGLTSSLDDSLRVKIECTIDDFIKNNEDAEAFVPLVTDVIAPNYSCAVPIGMCFDRIRRRLLVSKSPNVKNRCYYRSVESILSDLQAIFDNCLLYNSAESSIVTTAQRLIPEIKKEIVDVSNRHIKEREAVLEAKKERIRFVMHHCESSALEEMTTKTDGSSSKRRKAGSSIPDTLNAPYKKPLSRNWLQRLQPDHSWNPLDQNKSLDVSSWIPQAGDNILYARSLHARFVKGHYDSLSNLQCVLPRFRQKQDPNNNINDEMSEQKSVSSEHDEKVKSDISNSIQSNWLYGTIVSVRTTFPRTPAKDSKETFNEKSPILAIGLRFEYEWAKGETYTICWRPCLLPDSLGGGTGSNGCACESCGLSPTVSFLRPSWIDLPIGNDNTMSILRVSTESSDHQTPVGLAKDNILSIKNCLNMVKRRCIGQIEADFVDPRFCMENVKRGFSPAAAKMGKRSIPTYEGMFEIKVVSDNDNVNKAMTTRGVKKPGIDTTIDTLAAVHFLPPWSHPSWSHSTESSTSEILPFHETIMSTPNMCLEFILLRLANGYYRNIAGLCNDICEAYVSTVFCLLYEQSSRLREPVSVRKIARYLSSGKGNSGEFTFNGAAGAATSKATDTPLSTNSPIALTEEEEAIATKVDSIRRVYATALVCVLETKHVERIFCLVSNASKPPRALEENEDDEEVDYDPNFIAAVDKIRHVTLAFGKDYNSNNFKLFGDAKLKITSGGDIVVGDEEVPKIIMDPTGTIPQIINVKQDEIIFRYDDLKKNEQLAKFFFARTSMRSACGRCLASGLSFIECRVRRAHSNPDFCFREIFGGIGGVNGLLQPFLVPTEADSANTEEAKTASDTKAPPDDTTSTVTAKSNDAAESATASDLDVVDTASLGDTPTTSEKRDPRKYFILAKNALNLSHEVQKLAATLVTLEPRLSEKFIRLNFPVDPSDGKYTYCIICGLIGDVMCCDGCPNVVHPHCVNLTEAPDDDWFCEHCVAEGRGSNAPIPANLIKEAQDEAIGQPSVEVDNTNETTDAESPKLKSIESNIATKIKDTHNNSETMTVGDSEGIESPIDVDSTNKTTDANSSTLESINPNTTTKIEDTTNIADSAIHTADLGMSNATNNTLAENNNETVGDTKEVAKTDQLAPVDATTSTPSSSENKFVQGFLKTRQVQEEYEDKLAKLNTLLEELQIVRDAIAVEEAALKSATSTACAQNDLNKDTAAKTEPSQVSALESSKNNENLDEVTKDGCQTNNGVKTATNLENNVKEDGDEIDQKIIYQIPIGASFTKDFDSLGEFSGEVVALPTDNNPYYQVRYEDGDEEDLSETELIDCMPLSQCNKYRRKITSASARAGKSTGSSSTKEKSLTAKRMTESSSIKNEESTTTKQQQIQISAINTKRKRGRPRKYPRPIKSSSPPPSKPNVTPAVQTPEPAKPIKCSRPRKIQVTPQNGDDDDNDDELSNPSIPARRKRGRPPRASSNDSKKQKPTAVLKDSKVIDVEKPVRTSSSGRVSRRPSRYLDKNSTTTSPGDFKVDSSSKNVLLTTSKRQSNDNFKSKVLNVERPPFSTSTSRMTTRHNGVPSVEEKRRSFDVLAEVQRLASGNDDDDDDDEEMSESTITTNKRQRRKRSP